MRYAFISMGFGIILFLALLLIIINYFTVALRVPRTRASILHCISDAVYHESCENKKKPNKCS
jgi:hypothetical protein